MPEDRIRAAHFVDLASQAEAKTTLKPDAVDLLIDASALLLVEAKLPLEDAVQRLRDSYAIMKAAREAVASGKFRRH